jgi:HPt (histidine-containing phosphotransfer) domain-containing protein
MTFLAEIVGMLETDGRSLMAQLKLELTARNGTAASRSAHSLKGMILNFCAPTTQALAADIEKAAGAGDLQSAEANAAKLEPALESLISELAAFVKARS